MKNGKRVVFKKGRYVSTREGKFVLRLAKKILNYLKIYSKRIEIAGSIRRREKNPVDIDIVLIPRDKYKLISAMLRLGKYLEGGEKRASFRVEGVTIEIYFAEEKNWGAMLLSYTGPFEYCIGLRALARKKGMLLNQYGLFTRGRKFIVGKTEKEIYKMLGKTWKSPKLRGKD